jgi:endonuclease YncB( thermonuclease family)
MRATIAAIALLLTIHAAHADTIAGRATVIDGDTLEIHGERIRILNVDAPESRQNCQAMNDDEWRCGQWAANKLAEWIGQLTVTCETTRKDQYGRWLARCDVAGVSVANWLAGHGWAVPYRDCKCEEVRAASKDAELRNAGIWGGEFMMPWDWRKQHQ